jgi:hypothetical protein
MARLRQSFQRGAITSNPLGAAGTSITSPAFASLVEVAGGDILALTLDPEGAFGAPEIVHVTAHGPASTTVTVTRGEEGTVAREHPSGTVWRHGATVADYGEVEGANVLSTGEAAGLVLTSDGADGAQWIASGTTLPALLDDIRDNKSLLALVNMVRSETTNGVLVPLYMQTRLTNGANTVGADGGVFSLITLTTGNAHAGINTVNRTAVANRNPYAAFILTSRAAIAALKAQGWGFHQDTTAENFPTTTKHKAMFRSVTTGALFAVTGNASAEETTSLSASHTLGTAGLFEVFTLDEGVTWKFKIGGVEVASHSTQVPTVTEPMNLVVGIENNTTTDLRITNMRLVYGYQDQV